MKDSQGDREHRPCERNLQHLNNKHPGAGITLQRCYKPTSPVHHRTSRPRVQIRAVRALNLSLELQRPASCPTFGDSEPRPPPQDSAHRYRNGPWSTLRAEPLCQFAARAISAASTPECQNPLSKGLRTLPPSPTLRVSATGASADVCPLLAVFPSFPPAGRPWSRSRAPPRCFLLPCHHPWATRLALRPG